MKPYEVLGGQQLAHDDPGGLRRRDSLGCGCTSYEAVGRPPAGGQALRETTGEPRASVLPVVISWPSSSRRSWGNDLGVNARRKSRASRRS